jgi:hypothetical protein
VTTSYVKGDGAAVVNMQRDLHGPVTLQIYRKPLSDAARHERGPEPPLTGHIMRNEDVLKLPFMPGSGPQLPGRSLSLHRSSIANFS